MTTIKIWQGYKKRFQTPQDDSANQPPDVNETPPTEDLDVDQRHSISLPGNSLRKPPGSCPGGNQESWVLGWYCCLLARACQEQVFPPQSCRSLCVLISREGWTPRIFRLCCLKPRTPGDCLGMLQGPEGTRLGESCTQNRPAFICFTFGRFHSQLTTSGGAEKSIPLLSKFLN